MDKEKVTAKTEDGFIREVALDCVANMNGKDKDYIRDNPYAIDYHFGYAMYIRNHYIHCKDFSDANFRAEPDHLSGRIMKYIFSILLPDEYIFDDSFIEQLFNHKEFIRIRKAYRKIYDCYPVEMISSYRTRVPEAESKIDKMSRDEIRKLPKDYDFDAYFEISCRDRERRDVIITELISELAEEVWRVNDIKNIAKECGINPEELDGKIKEIKEIFFHDKEYIPMTVVLLPYRHMIGEKKYSEYRTILCDELDQHPMLMEKLDKSYFSERLKDDLSLALIDAAGKYPDVEDYSERLRDNEQVAEKLIEVHGVDSWKLRYMSDRIKEKYRLNDSFQIK